LGSNLTMCHWELGLSISITNVICATSCIAKFKDSSMHVFFHPSIWARMECFTLSGQCESYLVPSGKLSFHLVEANNFCALQGTIFDVKTFYPWRRLHGLCLWISTLGNSLKLP
jgi:hypothetical protein